ncbi:MAG TPA: dual specificity protein phosphatase family protein, partial [Candidatus Obscuribacterales bacterium]
QLAPYAGKKLRVGIMGVWTEAKVTYLAYELRTRYPEFELAVCSALTAGASRAQHFIALEQLEKLLGVKIFSSLAAFVRFLGGQAEQLPLTGWQESRHPTIVLNSMPALSDGDSKLVRYLFRDARVVRMQRLGGGYSGNEVFGTRSTDLQGHKQVSHVVKIGWHHLLGKERMAFEQIETVLGNNAPRIVDFVDLGERAALKYRYASMTNQFSRTLQSLLEDGLDLGKAERILYTVFVEQLGRLYAAAQYERVDLLAYYEFSNHLAQEVRRQVEKVLGGPAEGESVNLAGQSLPNLCRFYEETLGRIKGKQGGMGCYMSYVHGDLNGANILVDEHDNVWMIDFYHTHRGHVLRDLIKLENDLLYLMTPLDSDEALAEALALSRYLVDIEDLRAPLPPPERMGIEDPALLRSYSLLRILRGFYPELIHSDRNPLQLLIGQLRYATHTLTFPEASERQKIWALTTASLCAREIERSMLEQQGELWIAWLSRLRTSPGRLGMTILPGRRDRQRSLDRDIETLKNQGVTHVVCLATAQELEDYGVPRLLQAYHDHGLIVSHLPIMDQRTVPEEELHQLLDWIQAALDHKGNVLLHCVGGLGRSGTVAACYLRRKGLPPDYALAEVRAIRSPRAVESAVQEELVRHFGF